MAPTPVPTAATVRPVGVEPQAAVEACPALTPWDGVAALALDSAALRSLRSLWVPAGGGHPHPGPGVEVVQAWGPPCATGASVAALWQPEAGRLASTQSAVCADRVAAKLETEKQILAPAVVADAGGRLWLVDGHHSLVLWEAARQLGMVDAIALWVHATPGDTLLDAPRLVCACPQPAVELAAPPGALRAPTGDPLR